MTDKSNGCVKIPFTLLAFVREICQKVNLSAVFSSGFFLCVRVLDTDSAGLRNGGS